MNVNRIMIILLFAFVQTVKADNLAGFLYGCKEGPDGTEWQNPEMLSLNKEQPRAYIFPFACNQVLCTNQRLACLHA